MVTGATGFIGKNVLPHLKKMNFEVVGLYNNSSQAGLKENSDIRWEKCDLFDLSRQLKILKKHRPTHLLHLAWDVSPGKFWTSVNNIRWLSVSTELFRNFCESGGSHFICAGSIAEYDWKSRELNEEITPFEPETLYGQCKRNLYWILTHLQKTHYPEVSIVWPYIGYFFGSGEPVNKLISLLIKKIRNKETISLLPEDTIRSYAHVRHLGKILSELAVLNDKQINLNISANNKVKLKDIVNYIAAHYKVSTNNVTYDNYQSKIYEPPTLNVNTQKMERVLGKTIEDTFYHDLTTMMNVI